MENRDWNVEQLRIVIKDMDIIQAKFYMDTLGNEVADILNETQSKLKMLLNSITGEED